MMSEEVQLRIHGDARLPTLVYLPGLHGDWTLIGGFRQALGGRLRFVEVTYPRTLTWTLDEYAAGVEKALLAGGISKGWVLAESFSSQVAWPLTARKAFETQGLILAGGFVRHPVRLAVRMAERLAGQLPLKLIVAVLFGYARIARFRHRHSPETLAGIEEFIARRTELDRQAAKHRLHLIGLSDPCSFARHIRVPVFALTGLFDPVVPWFLVRGGLRRQCPSLREYRIIFGADHNVLSNAPRASAEQIVAWVQQ